MNIINFDYQLAIFFFCDIIFLGLFLNILIYYSNIFFTHKLKLTEEDFNNKDKLSVDEYLKKFKSFIFYFVITFFCFYYYLNVYFLEMSFFIKKSHLEYLFIPSVSLIFVSFILHFKKYFKNEKYDSYNKLTSFKKAKRSIFIQFFIILVIGSIVLVLVSNLQSYLKKELHAIKIKKFNDNHNFICKDGTILLNKNNGYKYLDGYIIKEEKAYSLKGCKPLSK